jgi:hypothetical protein
VLGQPLHETEDIELGLETTNVGDIVRDAVGAVSLNHAHCIVFFANPYKRQAAIPALLARFPRDTFESHMTIVKKLFRTPPCKIATDLC